MLSPMKLQPLSAPLTVAGTVTLVAYAVTTAKDTDFTCRAGGCVPRRSGASLTQGLIRARWRKGFFRLSPILPGEPTEYTIEVGNVGNCFLPGHRVKIHVSSALFPLYDRNLNTGEPSATCDHCETAQQQLLHDQTYASYLCLPVIPGLSQGTVERRSYC